MDDPQILQKIAEHAALTHELIERQQRQIDEFTKKASATQELAKTAAAALAQHERIEPELLGHAERALQDPVCALETLIKTANPSNTIRPAPLGQPETTQVKQARTSPGLWNNPNYCGPRPAGSRECDRKFDRAIGIG